MRNDARKNAFLMIFERFFHETDKELTFQSLEQGQKDGIEYCELKKQEDIEFFENIMSAFEGHGEELKEKIEKHLKNFSYDRLFKVDLALIYLVLCEVCYCQTPRAVAINEALEIAKKYSTEKSSKFINGIVSAIINEQ